MPAIDPFLPSSPLSSPSHSVFQSEPFQFRRWSSKVRAKQFFVFLFFVVLVFAGKFSFLGVTMDHVHPNFAPYILNLSKNNIKVCAMYDLEMFE